MMYKVAIEQKKASSAFWQVLFFILQGVEKLSGVTGLVANDLTRMISRYVHKSVHIPY